MKKSSTFFLKIATYQSTPKILYVLKGLEGTYDTLREQRTEERTKTYRNPDGEEVSVRTGFHPVWYSILLYC